ncbi:MAG: single-stranded DNA-binding protein [Patescibacteria group bacterium]|nr:single-stranded DNA-binding protein [Patescibacteria group bacterium]
MNFNKAIVVGNVTRDPEIRTTPSGQNVASIGVATNRVWNTASGEKQEKTEFHNIVAWGKLAEICGQYLTKGQLVLFEGRMETRSWEGQDGVKKYKTEIIAENMQMGPRTRSQENSGGSYQNPVEKKNENASSPQTEAPKQQPAPQENKKASGEEEIKIEDIPF